MKKHNIGEMKAFAEKKDGACLTDVYLGLSNKLTWKCKDGHIWSATPGNVIFNGSWCPVCSRKNDNERMRTFALAKKHTIEEMQVLAKSRNGECLSETYSDAHTHLKWRCLFGHAWLATFSNIINGGWCPVCSGHSRVTVSQLQAIAKERGGMLLSSPENITKNMKLEWQCKKLHKWFSSWPGIKYGSWCPICKERKKERICRLYFERFFELPFPKLRPMWLLKDKRRRLELDGFCKELGIAFEYQGEQHYQNSPLFNKNRSLVDIRLADEYKRKMCLEHNVTLIEIPYTIKCENIGVYLLGACDKNKLILKNRDTSFNFDDADIFNAERIGEFKIIAKAKGGSCLSEHYLGHDSKLSWQCREGHVFDMLPNNVKQGRWCPKCSNKYAKYGGHERVSLEMIKEAAIRRGGCFISSYKDNAGRLKATVKCKNGHVWSAPYYSIAWMVTWCPYCANNVRLNIKQMRDMAAKRGGLCLSETYVNQNTKLLWQCAHGHKWMSLPGHIKNGSWCPACLKILRPNWIPPKRWPTHTQGD